MAVDIQRRQFMRLRDGLIYRTESFFAPAFDPPAWRAQWVEIRPRPGA